MTLAFAAQLAEDATTGGGFQSKALAALINQCQNVLGTPAGKTPAEVSFAKAVLRNPVGFRVIAAWAIVGDAAVNATISPTEAQIINAMAARWPYIVDLGPV